MVPDDPMFRPNAIRPAGRARAARRPRRPAPVPLTDEQLARRLAPILCLHPNEPAMPMDPMQFIRVSRFRWHYSRKRDKGWNKETGRWKRTNSKAAAYYNVPVDFIDSFGLHPQSKKHRVPRKKGRVSHQQVFLDPRRRNLRGSSDPNGRIPAFYNVYSRQGKKMIEYWYFFGDNPFGKFGHEGDWVRTLIRATSEGSIERIWFPRHGVKPVEYFDYGDPALQFSRGRPKVYVSLRSHGTWHKAGRWSYENVPGSFAKLLARAGIQDYTAAGGYQWHISRLLQPLSVQPWRNFAGAWGGVGLLSMTTGPLGPWHRKGTISG